MARHYAYRGFCRACGGMADFYRYDGGSPTCGDCAARFTDKERAWLVYQRLRFAAGALTEWEEAVRTVGLCGGRYGAPHSAEHKRGRS